MAPVATSTVSDAASAAADFAASALDRVALPLKAVNLSSNGAATYPAFAYQPKPKTTEEFIARAKEVADLLAIDVAERDNNNEIPYKQVQLLKDAGLVTALGPLKYGGGGQTFDVGYLIEREVSAGDGSIGQLLGYHYLWSYTAQVVGTPEQIERDNKRYTEGNFLIGGAVNPRDSDLTVTEAANGTDIVFNGRKAFSTGSKVSDLTVLEGVLKGTETHVFALAPSKQPGIQYGDDWKDVLGMRGTQSGSVKIENVTVPWSDALGFVNKQFVSFGAYQTLLLPSIQNIFANFYLGIAQGALRKAAEYTAKNTRAWPYADDVKSKGSEEFYIQEIYGDLQSKIWGVEAQLDKVGLQVRAVLHKQPRESVTAEERGELAVRVAAGKQRAIDVGLEVTSKIYEVMGARSISLRAGFDHFWRNIRTHSLHDPIAHKRAEVGRYVVDGVLPTPTWYT